MTEGGRGSKNIQFCVTSFKNDPLLCRLQMKPAAPISAEDRVVQTMELLTDCNLEKEKLQNHVQKWSDLQPSAPGENTPEAQV